MRKIDGQGLFQVTYADWADPDVEGVFWYRGGWNASQFLGYKIGAEQPGGRTGLTHPSLQNPATVLMYAHRDDLTCHLCLGAILLDRSDSMYERRRPSPDHLTPRSQGGTDLPSNIRTAHLSCNKSRGDMSLDEWFTERSVSDSRNVPTPTPTPLPSGSGRGNGMEVGRHPSVVTDGRSRRAAARRRPGMDGLR